MNRTAIAALAVLALAACGGESTETPDPDPVVDAGSDAGTEPETDAGADAGMEPPPPPARLSIWAENHTDFAAVSAHAGCPELVGGSYWCRTSGSTWGAGDQDSLPPRLGLEAVQLMEQSNHPSTGDGTYTGAPYIVETCYWCEDYLYSNFRISFAVTRNCVDPDAYPNGHSGHPACDRIAWECQRSASRNAPLLGAGVEYYATWTGRIQFHITFAASSRATKIKSTLLHHPDRPGECQMRVGLE